MSRIHEAGVYVAKFFEGEKIGRMFRAFKYIRRSAMNGNTSGGRCRVGFLAGV
jgi:hypothetical protein